MNLNSADEISFDVYKEINGITDPLWNDLSDFKLVYIPDIDEFFQIEVQIEEASSGIVKSITGTSLCEAELSQVYLYDIQINSEDDIARSDYVVAKFYSQDDYKNCLLGRILSKVPHYKIGHVDKSLWNIQRTYSVDNKTIYNFLTDECAEQTNCIFSFDSTTRTIDVYDLYTVCNDCGHRASFNDVCPECGSSNLKYFGEDTTIYVDRDNLSDEIQFETDTDSVKNTFKLEAGDDEMTAAVINMNPNGSQYLYYFPEETLNDMSEKLRNCINEYNEVLDSKTEEYEKNAELLYEAIDKIQYYTSSMMPEHKTQETSASQQAKLLNASNLSPVAIQSVTTATSVSTANSAVTNYAKVYIRTGYYKVVVKTGKFNYIGYDSNGYKYGSWTGNFTVTSYSDDEDTVDSEMITIKITEQYDTFLQQKMNKLIAKEDDDDMSIYDVLSKNHTLESFTKAITYYSLNRLKSFYDAIQTCLDVLVEADQASSSSDFYKDLYLPYKQKLQACQTEMDLRNKTIDQWTQKYDYYMKIRNEIQKELNFKNFLDENGEDLYTEFCSFRREDTYQNSNYVSDGLQNAQIFDNAKQFLSAAKKAIVQSGEYQHSLSSNLYNLLLLEPFKPLVDKFELGNWIRIGLEGKIYRLRLISYTLKFSDLSKISVAFSDLTITADGYNDIKSILSKAKSMSTSFPYVQTQAEKGSVAKNTFDEWQSSSLNASMYNISSNSSSDIVIDNHGILGRSYDDITDSYSDQQIRINNNVIAFTDDNWNTVKTVLGKISYDFNGQRITKYGLNTDTVISGTIIGGDIYSYDYLEDSESNFIKGTHINLNTGEFSISDGKIVYSKQNQEDGTVLNKITATGVDINGSTIVSRSEQTNYYIKMQDGSIGLYDNENRIGLSIQNQELRFYALGYDEKEITGRIISSPYDAGGTSDLHIELFLLCPQGNNLSIGTYYGDSSDDYRRFISITEESELVMHGYQGTSIYNPSRAGSLRFTNSKMGFLANYKYSMYIDVATSISYANNGAILSISSAPQTPTLSGTYIYSYGDHIYAEYVGSLLSYQKVSLAMTNQYGNAYFCSYSFEVDLGSSCSNIAAVIDLRIDTLAAKGLVSNSIYSYSTSGSKVKISAYFYNMKSQTVQVVLVPYIRVLLS